MHRYIILFTALFVLASCASKQEISSEEKKAKIFYTQGTSELVNRRYTKALKYLLEAHKLSPKDSNISNNLGMAYYFKEDLENANKHLKLALELDPKNTDARMNIATIYLNQERYDQAMEVYNQILEDLVYEQQFKTHYNIAVIFRKKGDIDKAIFHLKKSVNANDIFCPANYDLGDIYYSRQQFTEAYKSYYRASLGTCYNNPEPHWKQAMTLIELGRYADAKDKLEYVLGKFDTTNYGPMARRKILAITPLIENDTKSEFSLKSRIKKNLSSSDF